MNLKLSRLLTGFFLAVFAIALWQFNSQAEVTYCTFLCDGVVPTPTPTPTPSPEPEVPDIVVDASGGEDFTAIGEAYSAASCGDLIHVREGTYTLTSTLNLNKTCSEGNEITVQNYTGEAPVVTCSDPASGFKRVEFNGEWNVWDGIEVHHCYDGIKVYESNNTIQNAKIHHNLFQGVIIATTRAELVNIKLDNVESYYNGFSDDGETITCNNEEWNPTPPHNSPKHCHGVYISDFGCQGTDGIEITNSYLHHHAGRGIQWNGEGCESKMRNTLVQGNVIEDNSYGLALWFNVDDSTITNNELILNGHPQSDDTSHGHFDMQSSTGNIIRNNTFFSNNSSLQTVQFRQTQSDNDIDENVWNYASNDWKWSDSWRNDFGSAFKSVTGFEANGQVCVYTSPCSPTPPPTPLPATIVVNEAGGDDFTTIQAAVAVADPGDVIKVKDGTYTGKIDLTRNGTEAEPIYLENFEGHSPVLIPGTDSGERLEVNAEWWIVRGFEIKNSWEGVKIQDDNFVLADCLIHNNMFNGVIVVPVDEALSNIELVGNTIEVNGYVESETCTKGNIATSCTGHTNGGNPLSQKNVQQIYLSNFTCDGISNVHVHGNTIRNYGGRAFQMNGLTGGDGEPCGGVGITGNLFEDNVISNGSWGVTLFYGNSNNIIRNNVFTLDSWPTTNDSDHFFIGIWSTTDTQITGNGFNSTNPDMKPFYFETAGSDCTPPDDNDIDFNAWDINTDGWVYNGLGRNDFSTAFTSVTGCGANDEM